MDANALGTMLIACGVLALAVALLLPLVVMFRGTAETQPQPQRAPADS
jgi:hypothetical protein